MRDNSLVFMSFAGFAPSVVAAIFVPDQTTRSSLLLTALLSMLAYLACDKLIPIVSRLVLRRGIFGMDINKKGTAGGEKKIPESVGLAPAVVFLICVVLSQQIQYFSASDLLRRPLTFFTHPPKLDREVVDDWLVNYNAALATICFMLLMGFVDDVLDVPWRVKLVFPLFASLPLLVAYNGGTSIRVPPALRELLPMSPEDRLLDIGILYKLYMVLLVIFCSNSINILAGVNGLEAGQTFVISCAVILCNILHLVQFPILSPPTPPEKIQASNQIRDGHLFSAYLMVPLAATTFALLKYNWYPSRVFVGDTFTYFAGMSLAVSAILGHYSETLLLFLIPQVFNFIYSIPQLFGLVACPRHRVPIFNPETGLLTPSPNLTILNLVLRIGGPCSERDLCRRLLWIQAACCIAGLGMQGVVERLLFGKEQ